MDRGTETMDRDTETVARGTETMDAGTETVHTGTDIVDRGTEAMDRSTETVERDTDLVMTLHHVLDEAQPVLVCQDVPEGWQPPLGPQVTDEDVLPRGRGGLVVCIIYPEEVK